MTAIVSVYAVFGSDEEARRIGRAMVDERLAACVNILGPCFSVYHWQGRIEEGDEVAALFKTREARAERLIARIAELHSYDVPAVVAWPILQTVERYEEWVAAETASPGDGGKHRS